MWLFLAVPWVGLQCVIVVFFLSYLRVLTSHNARIPLSWFEGGCSYFAQWLPVVCRLHRSFKQQNLGRWIGATKMHLSLPPSPQWLRLVSVLRWWFCCCCFLVYCCLNFLRGWGGGRGCLVLFLWCSTRCPLYVFNHLAEEERVGCLTLMFLLDFLWLLVLCVSRYQLTAPWVGI